MEWPDIAILGIITLSVIIGLLRGFLREVFALIIWFAAFLAAYSLARPTADWIGVSISQPSARLAVSFIGVFLAVLLLGSLLNWLLGRLITSTGLGGTDRLFGAVFGALRGLALVIVVLLAAAMTPLVEDPWWRASASIERLMPLLEWSRAMLPDAVAELIVFDPDATPGVDGDVESAPDPAAEDPTET